jgi:hypothetical protein
MKTIEVTVTITPDGKLTAPAPPDILPGEHRAVVVIEEKLVAKKERQPLKFSAYPVGLVSETMTFRREDIYGDDGR